MLLDNTENGFILKSNFELKKAYFIKAKKFHPDVNKASDAKEKFAEINK